MDMHMGRHREEGPAYKGRSKASKEINPACTLTQTSSLQDCEKINSSVYIT